MPRRLPPRFRSRDVVQPQREHLAYGFTVTRLPTGFKDDRWELKDIGGRTIARGTAVDWRDTRRLAEIALRRHLQKTGTERDVSARQRAFIREKIPILIDEGYPQRQAIAIAYRMAGVPPRSRARDDVVLDADAFALGRRVERLRREMEREIHAVGEYGPLESVIAYRRAREALEDYVRRVRRTRGPDAARVAQASARAGAFAA